MIETGILYGTERFVYPREALMDTLADRLRTRRKDLKLTQEMVAEKLGMKGPQYNRYENGAEPKSGLLRRMAIALDCTTDYLLSIVDEPSEHKEDEGLPEDQRDWLELYRNNPALRREFRRMRRQGITLTPGAFIFQLPANVGKANSTDEDSS